MDAMKKVKVKWVDSCSPADSNWHRIDELSLQPLTCESIGFVVSEDKHQISVAGTVAESGSVYGVMTIPKRAVLKIMVIR